MLSDAGLRAVGEGGADRDARVHPGDQIGDRDARFLRPATGAVVALAGDAHEAAHALDHEVVSRPLAPRPGVAETGNRAVDEPWIDFLQLRVAQAVAVEIAELEVL